MGDIKIETSAGTRITVPEGEEPAPPPAPPPVEKKTSFVLLEGDLTLYTVNPGPFRAEIRGLEDTGQEAPDPLYGSDFPGGGGSIEYAWCLGRGNYFCLGPTFNYNHQSLKIKSGRPSSPAESEATVDSFQWGGALYGQFDNFLVRTRFRGGFSNINAPATSDGSEGLAFAGTPTGPEGAFLPQDADNKRSGVFSWDLSALVMFGERLKFFAGPTLRVDLTRSYKDTYVDENDTGYLKRACQDLGGDCAGPISHGMSVNPSNPVNLLLTVGFRY